jgi:exonuclease VII small subunit
MKLKYLIPIFLIFIIGAYILGSNSTKNQTMQGLNPEKQENKQQQNVIVEYEQEIDELREEITDLENHIRTLEEIDSTLEVSTGSKETIMRKIEGMEQEIEVINYRIDPYNIHYQLDESFGVPRVNQNRITYSSQNNINTVSFEVIEHTSFEQVVSNLQKRFEKDGYEDKGELESTLLEENGLRGKMQFFAYPVKGFYAYEIDKNVLAITYQYSGESGDGMFPLLESLRKSINASIDVNSCEKSPKTLNWNGKEYVLKTENTSVEPVMKYGYVKCNNGSFTVAEDDVNSMIVRGVGNPTKNNDIIIIGKWGRALYTQNEEG